MGGGREQGRYGGGNTGYDGGGREQGRYGGSPGYDEPDGWAAAAASSYDGARAREQQGRYGRNGDDRPAIIADGIAPRFTGPAGQRYVAPAGGGYNSNSYADRGGGEDPRARRCHVLPTPTPTLTLTLTLTPILTLTLTLALP